MNKKPEPTTLLHFRRTVIDPRMIMVTPLTSEAKQFFDSNFLHFLDTRTVSWGIAVKRENEIAVLPQYDVTEVFEYMKQEVAKAEKNNLLGAV